MTLLGRPAGGALFRSKKGGGEWLSVFQATGSQVLAGIDCLIPKNLAADRASRKSYGQVPAVGFYIELTVTADNGGPGTLPKYVNNVDLLSYFDMIPQVPLNKKYAQGVKNLADWHFIGQVVNPRAANLRRYFVDFYQNNIAPWWGLDPVAPWVDPSVFMAGTTNFQAFGSKSSARYPETDIQDSYWGQLEGRTLIRSDKNTVSTVQLFTSFPLTYGTAVDGLMADSIPLATLCDTDNLWNFRVKQNRAFEDAVYGALVHAALGGSVVVSKVGMYLYILDRRMEDKRVAGLPYWVTDRTIAQLEIAYNKDTLYLFSGNFPRTVPRPGALVEMTYGPTNYVCPVAYGNFNPDMLVGNQQFLYVGAETYFPVDSQYAHPSELYESYWNAGARANPEFQRPFLRYGKNGDISPIGGASASNLGFANRVDADVFGAQHGLRSAAPVRFVAGTMMEVAGLPGFGSLDTSCGDPRVKYNGTFDLSNGGLSSLASLTDIEVSKSEHDLTRIRDMGENCCKSGTIVFMPMVPDASSPKAPAIAPYLPVIETDTAAPAVPG